MNPSQIEAEIQVYIQTLMSGTTYSELFDYTFEGIEFDVDPDVTVDSWMLFRIAILTTDKVEIRRGGIGLRHGVLIVVISTPKNLTNGKRLGLDYASEIEDDFEDYETTNIIFQKPNTTYSSDLDYHKHLVTIPFYTTIGE